MGIPAALGSPLLEPGHAVAPDEIAADGPHPTKYSAGLSAATLPFLHERDVALLGMASEPDVTPPESTNFDLRMPVHSVGLVAMGLWILDNAALDDLTRTCQEKNR